MQSSCILSLKGATMNTTVSQKLIPVISDTDMTKLQSALSVAFSMFFIEATQDEVKEIFGA